MSNQKIKSLVKDFVRFRDPDSDIRCLDIMYQQFACSEEEFFHEDRVSSWFLYKSLRDLLEVIKEQAQEGGSDEK